MSREEAVRDVIIRLKSEKVNERKVGRQECAVLLEKDKTEDLIPIKIGQDLLMAILSWESKEMQYVMENNSKAKDLAGKKSKSVDLGNVLWVRQVLRNFISNGQKHFQGILTFKKVYAFKGVVEHILDVLQNRNVALSSAYHMNHKKLLCDVLDCRVSHSFCFSPEVLYSILSYLRDDLMVDQVSVGDALNQRLLRTFCKALFSDEGNVAMVTTQMVEWICSEESLLGKARGDKVAEVDIVMTIADCCSVLLDSHGASLFPLVCQRAKGLLLAVVRLLPQQKGRDLHRDAYLRFLLNFLRLSTQTHVDVHSVFSRWNPLAHPADESTTGELGTVLDLLCLTLCSDDFLRSVVVYGTNVTSLKQTRDAFGSPLEEPKLRLYFDVLALATGLHELHVRTLPEATNTSSPVPPMVERLLCRLSTFDLLQRTDQHQTGSAVGGIESQASINPSPRGTPVTVQTGLVLFEGLLLVLQSLVRQFPLGEPLLMCSLPGLSPHNLALGITLHPGLFSHTELRLAVVTWLVSTLRGKLLDSLSAINNRQVLGTLLNTLSCLARLTRQLLDQKVVPSIVVEPLSTAWAQVMRLVLQDTRLEPFAQVCKSNSVTECYITLVYSLLQYRVLDQSQQWQMMHMLWQLPMFGNPGLVESSVFLHLLNAMVHIANYDTPVLLASSGVIHEAAQSRAPALVVHSMSGQPFSQPDIQAVDDAVRRNDRADSPSQSRVFDLLRDRFGVLYGDVRGPLQGVAYVILWLETQLNAPSSARVPLSCVSEVGVAVDALMCQAVPPEDSWCPFLHVVPGIVDEMNEVPPQPVPDLRRATSNSKDFSLRPPALGGLSTWVANTHGDQFVGPLSALNPVLSTSEFKATYFPHGNTPWFDGGLAEDCDEWRGLWRGGTHASSLVAAQPGFNSTMFDFLGSSALGLAKSVASHGCDNDKIADTELLLPIERDVSGICAEAAAGDDHFKAQVEQGSSMLRAMGDLLLEQSLLARELAVSSDHPTSWQVVSLLLCRSMTALSANIDSKIHGRSREVCEVGMTHMLLKLVESFWRVVDAQIQIMDVRMHSMKWSRSSEYLHQLALLVKGAANIKLYTTSKRTGEFQTCAEIRSKLCGRLFDLLHTVRDYSVPGLKLDQSSMVVSGSGDATSSDTQGRSSSTKKRARGVDISFDDNDDDDFYLGTRIRREGSIGSSSGAGIQPDEGLFDDEADDRSSDIGVGGKRKRVVQARVSLTNERQKAFVALATIIDIAAFDHDAALLSVFDVLRERKAGESTSRRHGQAAPSPPRQVSGSVDMDQSNLVLHVNSELFLQLAESLSSVYSTNSIFQCFSAPGVEGGREWLREWGTLGCYQALRIVYNLTSRPTFFLCAPNAEGDHGENPRRTVLNMLFSISAGEKSMRKMPMHYWRVRYMQVKCLANFVNKRHDLSDRPDCYVITDSQRKAWLLGFILDRLRDTDIRVRLLSVSRLPLFIDFFGNDATKLYDALAKDSSKELLDKVRLDIHALKDVQTTAEIEVKLAGVSSIAVAIAQLGVSHATLRQRALLDCVVICQVFASSSPQSRSRHFYGLLYRLVGVMASSTGYSTSREYVLDHFRWVLYAWLDSLALPLADFPFWLLSGKTSSSCLDFLSVAGEPPHSSKALLLGLRDIIVPVISLMKDSVSRFEALKAYSVACGYGKGDHDLSLILTHSIPALRALEVSLESMALFDTATWTEAQSREKGNGHAVAHSDFASCNLAAQVATMVYDFTHFIAEARLHSMSELWVSDIVLSLFCQMTYSYADPREPMYMPVDVLDAPPPKSLLSKIDVNSDIHKAAKNFSHWRVLDIVLLKGLHDIADLYGRTVPLSGVEGPFTQNKSVKLGHLFLDLCNLTEILSGLHARLCQTRTEKAQMVGLAGVDIIFHSLCGLGCNSDDGGGNKEPAIHVPLLAWQGIHSILTLSLRRAVSSRVLKQACDITARVSTRLFQEAFGLPSSAWEGAAPAKEDTAVVSYFHAILSDLVPMVLFAMQAVHMCRYQRAVEERFTVEVDEEIERAIDARNLRKKAARDSVMDVEGDESGWLAGMSNRRVRKKEEFALDEVRKVRRDPLVEASFAEMIAITPWSDAKKHISDCKMRDYESWRGNLEDSVRSLSSALDCLFGAEGDGLVHFSLSEQIYPLSSGMMESITLTGYVTSGNEVADNNQAIFAWLNDEMRRRDMLQGRLRRFVELAQARLRGESVSILALWMQLDALTVILQADVAKPYPPPVGVGMNSHAASSHELKVEEPASSWSLFPDLTGRFLSSLVSLSGSLTAGAQASAFESRIMQIVGHLGAPDLMSLSQGSLPARDGAAISESGSNIHALKAFLINRLGGLLYAGSEEHQAASSALRYCVNAPRTDGALSHLERGGDTAASRFMQHRLNCLDEPNLDSIAPKAGPIVPMLLDTYNSISVNDGPNAFGALYPGLGSGSVGSLPPPDTPLERSTSHPGGCWDKALWKTVGKTYAEWVTSLTSAVIRHCYPRATVRGITNGPTVSKRAAEEMSNKDLDYHFLASLSDVCALSPGVAEAVLPFALYTAVKSRQAGGEANKYAATNIATLLSHYVLSPSCTLKLATRLGCAVLVFFLRQEVDIFKRRTRSESLKDEAGGGKGSSKSSRREASKSQKASRDSGRVQLYTYSLNVDLLYAAHAAARCGCYCTALVFAELDHEHRQTGLFRKDPRPSRSPRSTASDSDEDNDKRRESAALLVRVFEQVHDPDALFGMLKEGTTCFNGSASLSMQAKLYAHTGNWMEALATYESALQCNPRVDNRSHESIISRSFGSPEQGMLRALRGLGFQHVMAAYGGTIESALLDHSGARESADVMAFGAGDPTGRSEMAWRNLDQAISKTGARAAASLGKWDDLPSVPSMLKSYPSLPFGDTVFSGRVSHSGVTGDLNAIYYDTSLASCIKDMHRGQPKAALERATRTSRTLLLQIGGLMSHESAYHLLPALVKSQQLYETAETCKVLDSATHLSVATENMYRDSTTAGATIDLQHTEEVIRKWSMRLSRGTSSGESAVMKEGIVSLRISLITQLLHSRNASACQALTLMRQINGMIPHGQAGDSVVHALSPLAYRLNAAISSVAKETLLVGLDDHKSVSAAAFAPIGGSSDIGSSRTNGAGRAKSTKKFGSRGVPADHASALRPHTSNIWEAEWKLQESKLLWRKGLDKVALRSLDDSVVQTLRAALNAWPPPSSQSDGTDSSSQVSHYNFASVSNLLSEALRLGGEWISDKRAASGSDILKEYLSAASEHAQGKAVRVQAELSFANFNDQLYHELKARRNSPEHAQLERVIRDRKQEYERSQNILRSWTAKEKVDPALKEEYRSLHRHVNALLKETTADAQEQAESKKNMQDYLEQAMRGFGNVLAESEDYDLEVVFRTVSIWVTHRQDKGANDHMERIIRRTKSFKFVPLTYQLLALLGDGDLDNVSDVSLSLKEDSLSQGVHDSSRFQVLLQNMVRKLCSEHPYHCLPQLFALINRDESGLGSLEVFKAKAKTQRSFIAESILGNLRDKKASGTGLAHLVEDLDSLLKHYITLANVDTEKYVSDLHSGAIRFDEIPGRNCTEKVSYGTPFDKCLKTMHGKPAVITITPHLQKDGIYLHPRYQGGSVSAVYDAVSVVHMTEIEDDFNITDSGVSRPKIVKVRGSDGITYKQLVKGGDDVRQDAVMEQVFANVNEKLSKDEDTRKRRLNIRTYKCVPCTPQTGVIEWVEGCRPLGDFLMHRETGLHARYYPHDWTHRECRERMSQVKDDTAQAKEAAFRDVLQNFHPVFRFQFVEQYSDPAQWLSCRLAYTRSVAVNSMIGYVMGIGDRHSNNILIDVNTSEMVHIDFGIVFDQGKLLPTPETVPFRLTRDVIDGMGITGVEGTFRRSCEQVLGALRKSATQVLTICEVVVRDPLYKWSLSPLEARKKQLRSKLKGLSKKDNGDGGGAEGTFRDGSGAAVGGQSNGTGSDEAHVQMASGLERGATDMDVAYRTIMTMRSKLQGYENPTGEALSVEGHVEILVQSATDTKKLSRLYSGWAAWL